MKNVEDIYPLSPLQEGILFHCRSAPGSGVYVNQLSCRLRESVDGAALRHAWRRLVERHPILRTAFLWEGLREPHQAVRREVDLPWVEEDLSAASARDEACLERWLADERRRPLSLSKAPVMRLRLVRIDPEVRVLVWTYHHLLLDGWSIALLLRELAGHYAALVTGRKFEPRRSQPYRDYIGWLRRQDSRAAEAFWRAYLAGFDTPTSLGLESPSAVDAQRMTTAERAIRLSSATTARLQSFARSRRVTASTLTLAAWAILIGRYSGEDDVVFGCTVAGRPPDLPGSDSMIGLFINTVPVRLQVRRREAFLPWLDTCQTSLAELRQFEFAPLVEIQGWSQAPRGAALFESLVAFENYPTNPGAVAAPGELGIERLAVKESSSYPLNLQAMPGDTLELNVLFDPELIRGSRVARLLGHLETLIEAMVSGSGVCLGDLPLLSAAEHFQLTVERTWIEPSADDGGTLSRGFEAIALRWPEKIAVVFGEAHLTYQALDRRADAIAERLLGAGVEPGARVALLAPRSPELVVGLIGILKAGAAYVPVDPSYPIERISFLLADSLGAEEPAVVLAKGDFGSLVRDAGDVVRRLLFLPLDSTEADSTVASRPAIDGESLAYVIYTSGSTGRPKPVGVSHRNVLRLFASLREHLVFDPEQVWTLFHSCAFDFSVWEIWGALLHGGRLVGVPESAVRSPEEMSELLTRERVTLLSQTPSAFRQLVHALSSQPQPPDFALSSVVFGGEALQLNSLAPWFERFGDVVPRMINMYGITETTVHTTFYPIRAEDQTHRSASPIGTPLSDLAVYLLDRGLDPVPIGAVGEIFVAGEGVACGYLGRPDLTAQRFLPNPFSAAPGDRLYRSGDLARIAERGDLEYLGRGDRQVKLRGYRIELGEIEAALAEHPGVRDAAVIVDKGGPGEPRLVAYAVPEGEGVAPEELRSWLKRKLPPPMVPAAVVPLASLPLTAHGKLDRGALPAPDPSGEESGRKPRAAVDEILVRLWCDLLGRESIGFDDNFFDLGGHSLIATQLMGRVRDLFQVNLPLREIFLSPTIAGLAESIERARKRQAGVEISPIIASPGSVEAPLSFAQEQVWFVNHLEPGNPFYNRCDALRIEGFLDVSALAAGLAELRRRHSILRTRFPLIDDRPLQVVEPSGYEPIPILDLSALPSVLREGEARRSIDREARLAFDLSAAPPMRVRLMRTGRNELILVFSMHHIIWDGWSLEILVRELAALYRAALDQAPSPLPALPFQYADFARWQRRWMGGDALDSGLAFWHRRLAGAPPAIRLAIARPRPAVLSFRGESLPFELEAEVTAGIKTLSRKNGATLFMTLLAGFVAMLSHLSDEHDVLVGAPVGHREMPETEGLIGLFVNLLVLRTDLTGDPSFTDLIGRVRGVALEAYDHQHIPFDRIIDSLRLPRDLGFNPLVQSTFLVHQLPAKTELADGIRAQPLTVVGESARFDLSLSLTDAGAVLPGVLNYSTDLFDRPAVLGLIEGYRTLLQVVIARPEIRLSQLSRALTEREREKMKAALGRNLQDARRRPMNVDLPEIGSRAEEPRAR